MAPAAEAPVGGEATIALLRERGGGQAPNSLRARFTQEKRLRILRDVLWSSGTVTVDRRQGIIVWEIDEPETARVVLRGDGLYVDGEKRAEATGSWPTMVASLLTGVPLDLARHFELRFDGRDRLELSPRSPRLGERLEAVEIELRAGSTLPRRIRWTEPGGDVTVIDLGPVEVDPEIDPGTLEP